MELRPGTMPASAAVESQAAARRSGAGEPTVGRTPGARRRRADRRPRSAQMRGDTVHLDIIDRAGNMVSATPSGGWLQSSPAIPELGFCLGTRAQMFWLDEGHPAALAPGKRPRTTLSPTLALRDGEPYSPGARRAATSRTSGPRSSSCATSHAGMNLQEAIDAPAWHSEHFPSRSGRAPPARRAGRRGTAAQGDHRGARRRGHIVEVEPDWSEGRLTAAGATAGVAGRPPTRAACRAMRRAGESCSSECDGKSGA